MALVVTESWILERVRLNVNNLEDVRSLSLPGTYHEKISSLGESLRNFTRLKSLDLSRNAIESLQGLENLKMLEKLILYYNNVPSLQELYRLRYNQQLQELDLRLNPVARNEPDYRLFLIHMLPNLRRLDDRAVRDSERKAALMHFTTDQASELSRLPSRVPASQPATNPRVELVKSLAKPPSAVDADDAVLLDFAGKTTAELLAPRKLTGSANTKPHAEEYPPQVAHQMDRAHLDGTQQVGLADPVALPFPLTKSPGYRPKDDGHLATVMADQRRQQQPPTESAEMMPGSVLLPEVAEDLQKKYPNLMAPALARGTEQQHSEQYGYQLQVPKKASNQPADSDDPNLKYQDEVEAYTSYKGQGHFTAHPELTENQDQEQPSSATEDCQQSSENKTVTSQYNSRYNSSVISASAEMYPQQSKQLQESKPSQSEPEQSSNIVSEIKGASQSDEMPSGAFGQFLSQISGLADKYWNGANSLLKNSRFKNHLANIYKELTSDVSCQASVVDPNSAAEEVAMLKQKLREAQKENRRLQEQALLTAEDGDEVTGDQSKERGSLIRAQRDLSILRNRLQKSLEENKTLQERISLLESVSHQGNDNNSSSTTEAEISDIARENERLQNEIISLNIRLKQASQMQELATMLQESHKSLVQTNDHLLRELEDTRQRHATELKQLHWSYDQLKKHVSMSSQFSQMKTFNGAT